MFVKQKKKSSYIIIHCSLPQARDQLEQERVALKIEIEKLQQRYNSAQEKTIEAQTRMGELVDRLDRTEQSRQLSSQQLADTSATMQAYNHSKVGRRNCLMFKDSLEYSTQVLIFLTMCSSPTFEIN